jgi:hypothetical protein
LVLEPKIVLEVIPNVRKNVFIFDHWTKLHGQTKVGLFILQFKNSVYEAAILFIFIINDQCDTFYKIQSWDLTLSGSNLGQKLA